jgi:hypothetical protein
VGEGTFTYWTRPVPGSTLEVVSAGTAGAGTAGDVSRRVEATATDTSASSLFADATVMGRDWITMDSEARVDGNAATNGDITMFSNATLCGNAKHGVGRDIYLQSNAEHICGTEAEGPLVLPMVDQGDVPTNNSNGRFFSQDIISGGSSNVTWNSSTRTLTLDSNSSLTMGGQNYSLCRLHLRSNSTLIVAAGASVRIYFDSPEACGQSSGVEQLRVDSNTRITSTSGDPTRAAFLFVGSETLQTKAVFDSNSQVVSECDNELLLYGPLTDLVFDSNSVYCGAVAGKTLSLGSNTQIINDPRVQDFSQLTVAGHYVVDRWIECTGASANPPDGGC